MPAGKKITGTDRRTGTLKTWYVTTGEIDESVAGVEKFTGKRDGETTVGIVKIFDDALLDKKVEDVSSVP
jgi:hypothetical protein